MSDGQTSYWKIQYIFDQNFPTDCPLWAKFCTKALNYTRMNDDRGKVHKFRQSPS